MDNLNFWFVWPIGIAIWFLIGWVAFAIFEAAALRHNARKYQITLSFWLYTIGSKFPLSILMAGLAIGFFVGALGVHVLWHWCPAGSISAG